eukprot:403336959
MQVFCQSSEENNSFPQVITSESGLIAFTSLDFKNENQLYIFLSLKKLSTTRIKDFEDDLDKNTYDRLKRQLQILSPKIQLIFGSSSEHFDQVPLIMKPEMLNNSLSISSHSNRNESINKLMKTIKDKFNIEHMALWISDKIYMCTKGWLNIHEADKSMLYLYKLAHNDAMIFDIPLYFTHTSLIDDMNQIGKVPYRYVILQLADKFTLTVVSDPQLDINHLNEFVKSQVDLDMSQQFMKAFIRDSSIDFETPPLCTYWQFTDHKNHLIRSFAYKQQFDKYYPIIMTLNLQMPVIKDQVSQMKQFQQHSINVEDTIAQDSIAYQQYIFVKENNMQLFKIRDKRECELLILFEKEITNNLVALDFFKRLVVIFGDDIDSQKYDFLI